ncbi:MAG: phosphoribosylformimino-5-aminoimidazole carboxamide ribotide isomerase [Lachnospiraceae bacterium]|nr:phosphoribosylformimino-5-aminoimidazole carboxamide ribotide isomerase [Lachnospiraceae bacterium]
MEFRPCIDIHNGAVKQIVGSSLRDAADQASENFVSEKGAEYYASLFRAEGLKGGHIILLNAKDSPYYEATREQAMRALRAYPGGMQIGGGIEPVHAGEYLAAGASHVIVTSYVFRDGRLDRERLGEMVRAVGREHLVLDLSCRKKEDGYVIVTDRWQKETKTYVNQKLLSELADSCDEFLIHAVDVEGKNNGIEQELAEELSEWKGCPITYAGGVHSMEDLEILKRVGQGRIHVTVGSALDLYGGSLSFRAVLDFCKK